MGDAERFARPVELRVQRPAAERAEPVLGVAVRGQRVGLVQALLELRELVVQPPDLAERGAQQAVDRQLRPRRFLRQVADPVARPERDAAALRSVDAGEHAQQRRLPGPVAAHQRNAAGAGQRQAEGVEQHGLAVRDAQVRRLEEHECRLSSYPAAPQVTSEAGRTRVRRRWHYRARRMCQYPSCASRTPTARRRWSVCAKPAARAGSRSRSWPTGSSAPTAPARAASSTP